MSKFNPQPGENYSHVNGWNMRIAWRKPHTVGVRHSPAVRGGRDVVDVMRMSTFNRIARTKRETR